MSRHAVIGCVMMVATLVAGCAGPATKDAATASGSDSTVGNPGEMGSADGVAVHGTVIDEELAPVKGAFVVLDQRKPVMSGDDGSFAINGVPAGDHQLIVQALGFQSLARMITVGSESPAPIQVSLTKIPIQEPYQTLVILKAFSVCDVAAFIQLFNVENATGAGTCPLGKPKEFIPAHIEANWKYYVYEAAWPTADSFAIFVSKDGNCLSSSPCYAGVMGPSAQRIEGAPNNDALSQQYRPFSGKSPTYPEDKFHVFFVATYAGLFQKELNQTAYSACGNSNVGLRLGCPGVGMSTGIVLTMYLSVFYFEPPADPHKYSAVTDV